MNSFEATLIEEIRRRERVTFAEFMDWALYHPRHGYYTTGLRTGRTGDFVTNVQTGPLFGTLLAHSFISFWDALGCGRFTLVELGGADGALAESVLTALAVQGRGRSVRFHLVESSPKAREAARRRLSRFSAVEIHGSLDELEHTAGIEGCVYSNEFFDALPFHRVVMKENRLHELFVVERNGVLKEEPGTPSSPLLERSLSEGGVVLLEGQEAEVCLAVDSVMDHLTRILARGFVFTVDYGAGALDLYNERRPQGTRRTFFKHTVDDRPFQDPGQRDITAHVDFSRLARAGLVRDLKPVLFAPQGRYFLQAGESVLRQAVEKPSDAERPAVVRAIKQLVHPAAFGEAFQIFIQSKNAEGLPPPPGPNRLAGLGLS